MKTVTFTALALVSGFGLVAAASAGETVRGPELAFGPSTAQSWVRLDVQGRPQQVGLSLSEDALAGLGQDMVFLTVPLP